MNRKKGNLTLAMRKQFIRILTKLKIEDDVVYSRGGEIDEFLKMMIDINEIL